MAAPNVQITRPATVADLDALPEHMKGELIEGVLYAMARPRALHQHTAGRIGHHLVGGFDLGTSGPGGWWILPEPGIGFPDAPEVSPDLAGWRRERMPTLPRDAKIDVIPDWVCEILSPTTRRHNLLEKMPRYARWGVESLWMVDAESNTLQVFHRQGADWLEVGAFGDERDARLPPFDAVSTDVAAWWQDRA